MREGEERGGGGEREGERERERKREKERAVNNRCTHMYASLMFTSKLKNHINSQQPSKL